MGPRQRHPYGSPRFRAASLLGRLGGIAFTDLETAKAARLQVSAHDTVDGVVHLVTDPQTLTQLVDALERDAAERSVEA